MKEQQKYNGMKRAMERRTNREKFPTNFTFATMQKVRLAAAERDRREQRMTLFATIAASLFIVTCGGVLVAPYIKEYTSAITSAFENIGLYLPMIVVMVLLFIFDIMLRKYFNKKYSNL